MDNKPKIFVISGPPGSGKSTIGKILAEKVTNSAIVSTDTIRYLIKNGKADRGDPDWERQLNLGAETASLLANSFLKNGFNVFLDDVVCDNTRINIYSKNLIDPIFITLLPSKEVVARRDLERGKHWAMKERAMYLYDKIVDFLKKEKRFIVFDTTKENAEESAENIIKKFDI